VPLADRAIGNLQHWLIGTYHGVSRAQLQAYWDEFVFRHNRRKQPLAAFQTLLGLGTGCAPTPYRRIQGGRDVQAAGGRLGRQIGSRRSGALRTPRIHPGRLTVVGVNAANPPALALTFAREREHAFLFRKLATLSD
jgi:hypothetical protein